MTKTYIKNKGTTTFISSIPSSKCNSHDNYKKIDWDVAYDGKRANIELDINSNGKSKHVDYELTNDDLADILNIPAFNMPLEHRLVKDFPLDEEEFIMARPAREELFFAPEYTPKKIKLTRRRVVPLFKSLRIKKIKPRFKTFSSLRRRLLTPRPKTMRIILKPKTK